MAYEYARFGYRFVQREAGSGDDWQEIEADDVPPEFFDQEDRIKVRRQTGRDPWRDDTLPEGAVVLPGGAVRLANPEVDAVAEELGLSPEELRGRLNGAKGGTRLRVEEKRFDTIAKSLGLSPEEARDRFADRGISK